MTAQEAELVRLRREVVNALLLKNVRTIVTGETTH
jgi:hypothetical protein